MTTLILKGSPRDDGVTAAMVRCFLPLWDRLMDRKNLVTVIDAYQAKIKPCIHCGHCTHTPGCVYDDFIPIDRGLQEADLLVIASPVYCLGFPAPLKAIFDRTQQYFEAKFSLGIQQPVQKHKLAFFFAAFGSPDPRGVKMMEAQLRLAFKAMNATLEHTFIAPHTDKIPLNEAALSAEINRILLDIKAKI
ncbi:MAG: flavodoxin family protein [Treponema sp.]|jgi:multimeric flavodoxin WrbA|nr:flavodoxin family protein [Treponema sp.]